MWANKFSHSRAYLWPMSRKTVMTPHKRRQAVKFRNPPFSMSFQQIADEIGVSYSSLQRFFSLRSPADRQTDVPAVVVQNGQRATEEWEAEHPPPRAFSELSSLAQDCLMDLGLFCERILGEPLHDHQKSWDEEEEERYARGILFDQINIHARAGKTDWRSNKKGLWRLVGGGYPESHYRADRPLRDLRLVLVSGSERQADKNFEYIQVRLTKHPVLNREYGRFRREGLTWRASERCLILDGRRQLFLSGDYSLVCVGMRSHFIGRGADEIVADDPFDLENCASAEAVEKNLHWLRHSVFGRLEPGGRITIVGARLPIPAEPYGQIAEWPGALAEDFSVDDVDDLMLDEAEDYPRLFHTVSKPAVLDWGARVILCPQRFTWSQLMVAKRLAGPEVWEASWMQNPGQGRRSIAKRVWIYGGTERVIGGTEHYVGCMDEDRMAGQAMADPPKDASSIRVVSVDPSDTKWWGILCMDLYRVPGGEYSPILIDLDRNKHTTSSFLALLEKWWDLYRFRALVLERNIAKFLIENEAFLFFIRKARIKVIWHETNTNKLDAQWGQGTLSRDFERGRIRIPNADTETRWRFGALVKEALAELSTTDLLMALWFPKWHLAGLMAMASESGGWQGWAGAPGPHRAPPPRVARQFAGAGR